MNPSPEEPAPADPKPIPTSPIPDQPEIQWASTQRMRKISGP